jgi:hypothetical protein
MKVTVKVSHSIAASGRRGILPKGRLAERSQISGAKRRVRNRGGYAAKLGRLRPPARHLRLRRGIPTYSFRRALPRRSGIWCPPSFQTRRRRSVALQLLYPPPPLTRTLPLARPSGQPTVALSPACPGTRLCPRLSNPFPSNNFQKLHKKNLQIGN